MCDFLLRVVITRSVKSNTKTNPCNLFDLVSARTGIDFIFAAGKSAF